MNLHEQFIDARKQSGLTQSQAAKVCGVSPRTVWQWEQGKSTLAVTLEGAIARLKKQPTAS